MKPNTKNQGANDERTSVLAKVRRNRNRLFRNGAPESVLDEWDNLILWLLNRNERYNIKKKGLGK